MLHAVITQITRQKNFMLHVCNTDLLLQFTPPPVAHYSILFIFCRRSGMILSHLWQECSFSYTFQETARGLHETYQKETNESTYR
jgi:hypothetical protein